MNVQDAAKRLKKSEPTIRRWIRDGKLTATMIDGVYDIPESAVNDQAPTDQITDDDQQGQLAAMRAHIQLLERQLEEKDRQIEYLQTQLGETSHRHDTVVMQMSRLVEFHQQPFWKRWFKQKSLPMPDEDVDVMDAAPGEMDRKDSPDDSE